MIATGQPSPDMRLDETLLILGTDLAGKDHCANVVTDAAAAAGIRVERRRGRFSACADSRRTSEGKGFVKLCLEWLFLATLPLYRRLLPYLLALLIRGDLWLFRPPAGGALLLVSHTGLRLLAFCLGHTFATTGEIRLPAVVDRALRQIVPATGVTTIVLDVEHRVRAARLAKRRRRGTVDFFDRYLAEDPERSERIESFLVWLAVTYLGAVRIENNDLADAELLASLPRQLKRRCARRRISRPAPGGPG